MDHSLSILLLHCLILVVAAASLAIPAHAFQPFQPFQHRRHEVRQPGLLFAKPRTPARRGEEEERPKSRRLLKRIARETEEYITLKSYPVPLSQEERWVVKAIQDLCRAKSDAERVRIGHWLFHQADLAQFSHHHDTAIQALALSGQVDRALQEVEQLDDQRRAAVTDQTYWAIVQGLLDAGCLENLEGLLQRLGRCEPPRHDLAVRAFNSFLHEKKSLDVMYQELTTSTARLGIVPDAVSYSIVLHQAAVDKDPAMMKAVWDQMKQASVSPIIECFNARLRVAQTPEEILQIWDTRIRPHQDLIPDLYTIEYIMLPLVRAGRLEDLTKVLDGFVESAHPYTVTNSFTPFLLKLGRDGGEVEAARYLWDTYRRDGRLQPNVRHFNVLLGCYRRQMDGNVESLSGKQAHDDGWDLYRTLASCRPKILPDVITRIEMIGLCQDASELATFLADILASPYPRITGAVLRSALTSFGRFGDASSALWLFAKIGRDTTKAWNALFGSLIKAHAYDDVVTPLRSRLAIALENKAVSVDGTNMVKKDSLLLGDARLHEKVEASFAFMLDTQIVDSQSFCLMALFRQRQLNLQPQAARQLYANATRLGVDPDGRFLNGVLRCFGSNLSDALDLWKTDMRPTIVSFYQNNTKIHSQNLNVAYFGLFYVCGRALRPDVALRIGYAMTKDGLEPDERCLNTYRIGRRDHGRVSTIKEKLLDIHESLLEVECSKAQSSDDRQGRNDWKVRVILSPKSEYDYILDE